MLPFQPEPFGTAFKSGVTVCACNTTQPQAIQAPVTTEPIIYGFHFVRFPLSLLSTG
jgi:hypothetical protein